MGEYASAPRKAANEEATPTARKKAPPLPKKRRDASIRRAPAAAGPAQGRAGAQHPDPASMWPTGAKAYAVPDFAMAASDGGREDQTPRALPLGGVPGSAALTGDEVAELAAWTPELVDRRLEHSMVIPDEATVRDYLSPAELNPDNWRSEDRAAETPSLGRKIALIGCEPVEFELARGTQFTLQRLLNRLGTNYNTALGNAKESIAAAGKTPGTQQVLLDVLMTSLSFGTGKLAGMAAAKLLQLKAEDMMIGLVDKLTGKSVELASKSMLGAGDEGATVAHAQSLITALQDRISIWVDNALQEAICLSEGEQIGLGEDLEEAHLQGRFSVPRLQQMIEQRVMVYTRQVATLGTNQLTSRGTLAPLTVHQPHAVWLIDVEGQRRAPVIIRWMSDRGSLAGAACVRPELNGKSTREELPGCEDELEFAELIDPALVSLALAQEESKMGVVPEIHLAWLSNHDKASAALGWAR